MTYMIECSKQIFGCPYKCPRYELKTETKTKKIPTNTYDPIPWQRKGSQMPNCFSSSRVSSNRCYYPLLSKFTHYFIQFCPIWFASLCFCMFSNFPFRFSYVIIMNRNMVIIIWLWQTTVLCFVLMKFMIWVCGVLRCLDGNISSLSLDISHS